MRVGVRSTYTLSVTAANIFCCAYRLGTVLSISHTFNSHNNKLSVSYTFYFPREKTGVC